MIIFEAPKNYHEMLNKIGWYTFVGIFIATIMGVNANATIKDILEKSSLGLKFEYNGINFAVGYIYPAVVLGFIARTIKFHDKVSDLFRIRKEFDIKYILTPICEGLGKKINKHLKDTLQAKRDELMTRLFYKYASSTNAQIDTHLIITALDNWCGYWILLELRIIFIVLSIILLILGTPDIYLYILVALIFIMTILANVLYKCGIKYAKDEVAEILSDNNRRKAMRIY